MSDIKKVLWSCHFESLRVLKPKSLKTTVVVHSYFWGASSTGYQSKVLLGAKQALTNTVF